MEKTGRKRIDKIQKKHLRRERLITLSNNICMDCGYTFPGYVYEFHHIDPSTRSFNLSGGELTRKWADIVTELEKCDMLCANCHKIRHGELRRHGND